MEQHRVVICGAGKTGHLYAVLLKDAGHHVSILSGRAADIVAALPTEGICAKLPDGPDVFATPDIVTARPEEVIPAADLILITAPAHLRPDILRSIAPHVRPQAAVGAIPGNGGFDWLATAMLPPGVAVFGLRDTPRNAYNPVPGVSVEGGPLAAVIELAFARDADEDRADGVSRLIGESFGTDMTRYRDFLSITLAPGNPILHLPALYALLGPEAEYPQGVFPRPLSWWRDISPVGAAHIERAARELLYLQERCRDLGFPIYTKPLLEDMIERYGPHIGDPSTMHSALTTNAAFRGMVPLVRKGDAYGLDLSHRVFVEDSQFGLRLVRSIAERVGLNLPFLFKLDDWTRWFDDLRYGSAADYLPTSWPDPVPSKKAIVR